MPRLRSIGPRLASVPSRLRQPPKSAERFYASKEWIALRSRRVGDPDWIAAKARAAPGERLILDHIIERKDGGADLDPLNTRWLTNSEHQAKTAEARARRARAPR